MKKKVVIIAGIVLPSPTPPGKISLQYANMIKGDYDVSIIYIRTTGKKRNGEIVDGIKYYSVSGFRFSTENYFAERGMSFMVKVCKAIGRVQRLLCVNGNLEWFYKKAYQKLNEIFHTGTIDVVLSVCNPFQAHLAALKYKQENPSIRFVTYTVDSFVKGNGFSGRKLKKALKLERRVYDNSDYNFVSEEIFENEQEKFNKVLHKTGTITYLLINIQREVKEIYFENSKINLVYAGNFYKDIRNPEFMLETICKLNDDNIALHLYSEGECQELVDKYVKKSKGKIIKHAKVPLNDIINIMNSCDFLVNVSNNVKEFQPSKTFEYVAIGKPIISFFEGDNLDKALSKYPLCIQISNENGKLNELQAFVKNNLGKKLDFTDVEKIYSDHAFITMKEKLIKAM